MAGKTQIVDQVVAGGATRAQAAAAVDAVLDAITASLAAGERVTLTGFGTFEPAARPARTARNPRTGDVVDVAATTVARFRPGAALRTAVANGVAPALGTRPAPSRGTVGTSDVAAAAASDAVAAEPAPAGKAKGTAAGTKKQGKATASATKHGKSTAPAKKSSAAKADGKKHAKDGKGKGKKHASAAHSGKKHAKK